MITSDRQLNATKKKIDSLTESLAEMGKSAKGILTKSSVVQTETMKQEFEMMVLNMKNYVRKVLMLSKLKHQKI